MFAVSSRPQIAGGENTKEEHVGRRYYDHPSSNSNQVGIRWQPVFVVVVSVSSSSPFKLTLCDAVCSAVLSFIFVRA